MFLVLAGNTDEYEEWQRLHPELDARYVETAKEVLSCDESDSLVIYGSGADRVDGFEAPIDNGDGTFTGQDLLDVSSLHDLGGQPVNTADVTVTDTNGDGTGDAILTFPNGETLTLVGVLAATINSPEALAALDRDLLPGMYVRVLIEQGTQPGWV